MQTQQSAQATPDAINKFLIEQLQNTLNLLSQSQSIGNTHFLYPASVINGAAKSIQTVTQTLQTLSTPKVPPTENQVDVPPEPTPKVEPKINS